MTSKTHESIIILKRIRNQLHHASSSLKYLMRQKTVEYAHEWNNQNILDINTAMYGLINYSLLWYHSFLQEYHNYFTTHDALIKERVIAVKKVFKEKQYLKTLFDLFGDITEPRNIILAHGYRKDGRPITDKEFEEYHSQLMNSDNMYTYTQISNIVDLIIIEIEKEFGEIDESLIPSDIAP